jgi:tetratricopeptide (TPR) repeat protein
MGHEIGRTAMRKAISWFLVVMFCFYGTNLNLLARETNGKILLKKGIDYFNNAYFEVAIKTLTESISQKLSDTEKAQGLWYIALSQIALNRSSEAKRQMKKIVKIDPAFVLKQGEYPTDIENLFKEVKANFPIISELKALPAEFFPYRGNQPYFSFYVSVPDNIKISMGTGYYNMKDTRQDFTASGEQTYKWDWTDNAINAKKISLTMTPEKNGDEYWVKKEINLVVQMPPDLTYESNGFSISGRRFLEEYKTVPKKKLRNGAGISIGFGAFCFAAGIFLISSKETQKGQHSGGILYLSMGVVATIWPFIFKKKSGYNTHKPIPENIKKNEQLSLEIEQLKKRNCCQAGDIR